MKKGRFIVLEGGEGAGKGMCIDYLKERLNGRGDMIFTREPGGTPIAEKIRELLLSKDNNGMSPLTELFLFCGARAQHVNELIKPALESGKKVISDRFEDSTIAYQLFGRCRGELRDVFNSLNNIAKDGVNPDAVILLDVPVLIGLARKRKSGDGLCTRFDEEKVDFHDMVRAGFLEQYQFAKESGKSWYIVETTVMTEQEVKEKVLKIVKKILEE